ncbi:MAG TPA: phage antirepressor N-terminal domain-containing protein [Ktedonobacterales bacterium]|nr:phage antirepressor N-terminal domain-containing protein [Ktedonobacterales bacterium]
MTQVVQGVRYKSAVLTIPRFGVKVRAVSLGRRVYFPVKAVCIVLGLGWQTQKDRLRADSRFSAALRDIPVETTRGYRDTLCINQDKVATWLGLINPNNCKLTKTRERLEDFQRDLFAAADRFLWGDTGAAVASTDDAPVISQVVTGVLHVGACPGCGMRLCLTLDETGAHLTPEPDDDSE